VREGGGGGAGGEGDGAAEAVFEWHVDVGALGRG